MVSIKISNGTSSYLKGAYNVLQYFQHEIEARGLHDRINLTGSFCLGNCEHGVSVEIDGKIYSVAPETAHKFFEETVMPLVK